MSSLAQVFSRHIYRIKIRTLTLPTLNFICFHHSWKEWLVCLRLSSYCEPLSADLQHIVEISLQNLFIQLRIYRSISGAIVMHTVAVQCFPDGGLNYWYEPCCWSTTPGEGNKGVECSPFVHDMFDRKLVVVILLLQRWLRMAKLISCGTSIYRLKNW